MIRFLSTKGLSMSQAQSISNIVNQKAIELEAQLERINNYQSRVKYKQEDLTVIQGVSIPKNLNELLNELCTLRGVQAFLMTAIQSKDFAMDELKQKLFIPSEQKPIRKDRELMKVTPSVSESWGWEQLTDKEYAEFLYAEAMASHLGKFIHKGGKLDSLRKELPKLKLVEWMDINATEKTPVIFKLHHTSEELLKVYEILAAEHRKHEQKVNYYKAKVKNMVSDKNAEIHTLNSLEAERIAKVNDTIENEYQKAFSEYYARISKEQSEFQKQLEIEKKGLAQTRIVVDPIFQNIIDKILGNLEDKAQA
jgi:hypothetical protein